MTSVWQITTNERAFLIGGNVGEHAIRRYVTYYTRTKLEEGAQLSEVVCTYVRLPLEPLPRLPKNR